jgi:hypothetical protein
VQSNILKNNGLKLEQDIILNSCPDDADDDKIARFEVLTVVLMNIQEVFVWHYTSQTI